MAEYGIRCARAFSLLKALAVLEEDEVEAESVNLLPTIYYCVNTTDEDQIQRNNLPGSLMQADAEVQIRDNDVQ
ncbi:hypothetical protein HHI36_009054 [Cryptolaemus montrouzieri]|uniref:Uncharacterized protein n=1 Tax=Cryptolaemus montrouzieri TaxID=559131 RepID=A0ABD2MUT2_9CUCU